MKQLEQWRRVAQVEALLRRCDGLEAQMSQTRTISHMFATFLTN